MGCLMEKKKRGLFWLRVRGCGFKLVRCSGFRVGFVGANNYSPLQNEILRKNSDKLLSFHKNKPNYLQP